MPSTIDRLLYLTKSESRDRPKSGRTAGPPNHSADRSEALSSRLITPHVRDGVASSVADIPKIRRRRTACNLWRAIGLPGMLQGGLPNLTYLPCHGRGSARMSRGC